MKIYKFISIITLMFCTLCYLPVEAHQDTMLELKGNKIVGLPEQFQPATFNLENMLLQIGENRLSFPQCVTEHFTKNIDYSLYITASWYHDLSLLPPYIVFHLESPDRNTRLEFVFLMETLMPYSFNSLGPGSRFAEFSLTETCKKKIEKNISTFAK